MRTIINSSKGTTIAILAGVLATNVSAADWPQWRGPNRDGRSTETGLLKDWPSEGPKLVWQVKELGAGYSTPSVIGGRIFIMANKGIEEEFVTALDVKDGKQVWSTRIGKVGNPDQKPNYPGARSTPTVDGATLYVLSSDGDLASLNVVDGKIVFQRGYWDKLTFLRSQGLPLPERP